MEGEPLVDDPSPLQASKSQAPLNPLPISPPLTTHLLHRPHSPFTEPPECLPQPFSASFTAQQLPSVALSLCKGSHESFHPGKLPSPSQQRSNGELQESEYSGKEEKNKGGSLQRRRGNSMSGKDKGSLDQMYGKEHASATYDDQTSVGRTVESPGASVGEGHPEDFVRGAPPEVSSEQRSHMGSGASDSETENENTNSNDSSSGKDMAHDLSLHEDEKGEVSPLRALSHIAHIKRKQDCMQADFRQMHGLDDMHELSADSAHGSPSKKKKFKQVQFRLESLTYQKLTRLLVEQHQGSFERFVMATLNSIVVQDKMEKESATIIRKPAFSKWKRTRFDQLKGTETQELALAFRSLAEATPNKEVPSELIHTPWQELNMLQIQKMLEETKKMLLVNEKVHDCPYTDCSRRFSTPGNLKDHLNEHSGEQPYSCSFEDCPHRFRSKQHLCRHMKKHERAHTCTFEGCNKRFAFRERLIVHQKIHSDERPLSCPWEGCGKTFKWANSLHGHMRTHTGEKPFQCTFAGCGRLFGYKVDLTRHRRTHFGQPARASH